MDTPEQIMSSVSHRPYPLPSGSWNYYQEWNKVVFLHYKVPYDMLRNAVPDCFKLDSFQGDCYVSIVAFTMENIRPKYLPAVSFISDFHEVNVRTYIDIDGKKGVYFLSIEAQKYLSAFIAKILSGLPYEKSKIDRKTNLYTCSNQSKNTSLLLSYQPEDILIEKTDLDFWLTERYFLYLKKNQHINRYDIQHKPWVIKKCKLIDSTVNYKIGNFSFEEVTPDIVQFSDGIQVLSWSEKMV